MNERIQSKSARHGFMRAKTGFVPIYAPVSPPDSTPPPQAPQRPPTFLDKVLTKIKEIQTFLIEQVVPPPTIPIPQPSARASPVGPVGRIQVVKYVPERSSASGSQTRRSTLKRTPDDSAGPKPSAKKRARVDASCQTDPPTSIADVARQSKGNVEEQPQPPSGVPLRLPLSYQGSSKRKYRPVQSTPMINDLFAQRYEALNPRPQPAISATESAELLPRESSQISLLSEENISGYVSDATSGFTTPEITPEKRIKDLQNSHSESRGAESSPKAIAPVAVTESQESMKAAPMFPSAVPNLGTADSLFTTPPSKSSLFPAKPVVDVPKPVAVPEQPPEPEVESTPTPKPALPVEVKPMPEAPASATSSPDNPFLQPQKSTPSLEKFKVQFTTNEADFKPSEQWGGSNGATPKSNESPVVPQAGMGQPPASFTGSPTTNPFLNPTAAGAAVPQEKASQGPGPTVNPFTQQASGAGGFGQPPAASSGFPQTSAGFGGDSAVGGFGQSQPAVTGGFGQPMPATGTASTAGFGQPPPMTAGFPGQAPPAAAVVTPPQQFGQQPPVSNPYSAGPAPTANPFTQQLPQVPPSNPFGNPPAPVAGGHSGGAFSIGTFTKPKSGARK